MDSPHKTTVLYITASQEGGAVYSLLNMLRALRPYITPIVLFPNKKGLYSKFVEEGVECLTVPFREEIFYVSRFKKFPIWKKLAYIPYETACKAYLNSLFPSRVKRLLNGRKIDVVHTNTGAIAVGVPLAKALGAKHLWHLREFQDLDFGARPFFGWKRFRKRLAQSDGAVGITKAIADHFRLLSSHPNGTYVWNAVMSASDAGYCKDKAGYIFFASANISRGKGLHDLIEAYSLSRLPKAGIRLVVAGQFLDEAYHAAITRQIEQAGLAASVEFLGYCSDIRSHMSRAMAFVMPSQCEAMGRVAVEAMFYGCLAITRNSGGPAEFMRHGENGYVFNNVPQLAEILDKASLSDNERIILQAQQFAKENFSEEKYGEKINQIYKSLWTSQS